MQSIVALLWRIATFKAGPEAIPFSSFLASILVATNIVAASAILMFLSEVSLFQALSSAVVRLAATAGLTWTLLWIMRKKERFTQTFTAMVGTDVIIRVIQSIAMPLSQTMNQTLTAAVLIATAFWGIAIYGFIFHRALNIQIGLGFAVAFVLSLVTISITSTVFAQG